MSGSGEPPITPPLVQAIGEQLRAAHADNVAETHRSLDALITKLLEEHEHELSEYARPMLAHVVDHPALGDEVKTALRTIMAPEHQTQFFTALFAVRAIIDQFVFAAIAPLVQDVGNVAWPHDPSVPLSPAEAALAVLRHNMPEDAAKREAAMGGLNGSRFEVLVANTGDTIGLAQLQEALRRGFIDSNRFAQGVRESRVRDEWVDVLLDLKYVPVPIGEVLAGVVQGHLDPADARRRISEAGIDPSNFDWLFETHGRPPGVVELGELVNRGEMTEAAWEQAVRESDIKNKYIPFLRALHRRLMPERTVVSAVRQGVLDTATASHKLMELGFNAEDAATLVAEAHSAKKEAQKDLTRAQVVELYTAHLTTEAAARGMLGKLGYDASEVDFIIALADHERHARFQSAAVNRVHSLFVRYKKDTAETRVALDKLGVDAAGRDDMLALWELEREANVQVLTPGQLGGLVHRGRLTPDRFVAEVEQLGYERDDARELYFLAFPPTKQPEDPWK